MMKTFWLLMLTKILNFPPRVSGRVAGLGVLALLDLVTTLRRLSETMPKWSPDLYTIYIPKAWGGGGGHRGHVLSSKHGYSHHVLSRRNGVFDNV